MTTELKVLSFPSTATKKKKLRKYERADGRFCKIVTIKGERFHFYGTSTADVEKQAKEFRQLSEHGLNTSDYDITVKTWSERWFESEMIGKSERHRVGVQRQLDLMNAQIGSMRVRDVREIDLNKIINSRAHLSKSQIDKIYNVVQRVFASARKNHILVIDPAMDLKKPHGTYRGHRILEPWEINLLVAHYDCAPAGLWAITMMLAGTRRGETLALRFNDFDFDKGEIHIQDAVTFVNNNAVNRGKTKTEAGMRSAPMLEPLITIIRTDFAHHPRQLFATMACGKTISESSYNAQWDTLMRRLTNIHSGYPVNKFPPKNPERRRAYKDSLKPVHFTAHDLRYTYATILYDAGVDEKTAQRWLGHTSPEMTRDLYAKLTAERKAQSDRNLVTYFSRFQKKKHLIKEMEEQCRNSP